MSQQVEDPEEEVKEIDFSQHEDKIKEYLTGKGVLLKTQKEIDDEVSGAVRNTHKTWEEKVSKVTGKEKPAASKGLDWVEDVFKTEEKKEEPEKKSTVKEEVGNAKLNEVQGKLTELQNEIAKRDSNAEEKLKNTSIRSTLKGLRFDGADASEKSENRQTVEELLKVKYDWKLSEDNELVPYKKGESEPLLDPETGEPYEVSALVKKQLGRFLEAEKTEEQKVVLGTGTQKATLSSSGGKDVIVARNTEQIRDELVRQGHLPGSDEYNDIFLRSVKHNNLKW